MTLNKYSNLNDINYFLDKYYIILMIIGSIIFCTYGYFINQFQMAFYLCFIFLFIFLIIMYIRHMCVELMKLKVGDNFALIYQLFDIHDIGEFSDGYHTFNSLYNQRLYLFAALVNTYKDLAWKSKRHDDDKECFDGKYFIVGIDTPKGQYTYHYEMKYWNLFDCIELLRARKFDYHTDKDVDRLINNNE